MDLLHKWTAGGMDGGTTNTMPDLPKIRENAKSIEKLIGRLSYTRSPDTPADYHPSVGFMSGELVRFGDKNGETVLIIGQLGSQTVYNTRRLTEKQRVGTVVKEQVFGRLDALADCCRETGAKHVALVCGYGYKDFGEEYASTWTELVGFVASLEDCRKFLQQDITQEEFLRRSEVLVFSKGGTLKKIELTLE